MARPASRDPRTGHECGDSRYFAIPFLDACLAMRLPDKGSKDQTLQPVDMSKAWLAALGGDGAVPAAEYKGDPKESVWLPNEAVAKAWMEYVKTGAVGDTTPPPVAIQRAGFGQGRPGARKSSGTPRRISRAASAVSSCSATGRSWQRCRKSPSASSAAPCSRA